MRQSGTPTAESVYQSEGSVSVAVGTLPTVDRYSAGAAV